MVLTPDAYTMARVRTWLESQIGQFTSVGPLFSGEESGPDLQEEGEQGAADLARGSKPAPCRRICQGRAGATRRRTAGMYLLTSRLTDQKFSKASCVAHAVVGIVVVHDRVD